MWYELTRALCTPMDDNVLLTLLVTTQKWLTQNKFIYKLELQINQFIKMVCRIYNTWNGDIVKKLETRHAHKDKPLMQLFETNKDHCENKIRPLLNK